MMGEAGPEKQRPRKQKRGKARGSGGRPTRLTKLVHDAIVESIRAGAFAARAAEAAGIPRNTYFKWLQKGKAGRAPYARFYRDIQQAGAEAETEAIKIIANAMPTNWQAAAWFLERKFPKRYARKDRPPQFAAQAAPAQQQPGGARTVVVQIIEAREPAADGADAPADPAQPAADAGAPRSSARS